jgi:hypothetical protein
VRVTLVALVILFFVAVGVFVAGLALAGLM